MSCRSSRFPRRSTSRSSTSVSLTSAPTNVSTQPSCSCCSPGATTCISPTHWPPRSTDPWCSRTPLARSWPTQAARLTVTWRYGNGTTLRIDHDAATARSGTANDADNCTRKAVVLRGERWGWLHVLHGGEPIVGTAGYAIDRAADGIAIALLGARESGARWPNAKTPWSAGSCWATSPVTSSCHERCASAWTCEIVPCWWCRSAATRPRPPPAKKPWRRCAGPCGCPRWSPTSASAPWSSWACREPGRSPKSWSG